MNRTIATCLAGAAVASIVAIAGCTTDSDPAPYDLQIGGAETARGFDLHVGVVDLDTEEVVITNEWFPFERTATYGDLLDIDHTYDVYLFYDRNDDGVCGAGDSAWRERLVQVADTELIDLDTAPPTADACAYFAR